MIIAKSSIPSKVWGYEYPMAYTTFYKIDANSVTVKYISGIENEKDSVLMQRLLKESECKMVLNFLSSHNVERFKVKYSNPMVDDGDRKRVVFTVKGKSKTVEIANFYQKDMGELFSVLNNEISDILSGKFTRINDETKSAGENK
ncbi:hypothetical protein ACQ86N_26445 [Puia sp. P3]|uniref:hypothetical protein n=1 Tax=Puia sp. P3 TaxID=3423952 RepID=UPI003D6745BA